MKFLDQAKQRWSHSKCALSSLRPCVMISLVCLSALVGKSFCSTLCPSVPSVVKAFDFPSSPSALLVVNAFTLPPHPPERTHPKPRKRHCETNCNRYSPEAFFPGLVFRPFVGHFSSATRSEEHTS